MSSNAPVISVKGLEKTFRLYRRPQDRLKQMIMPRLGRVSEYFDRFTALKHVDLTLERGETVGIVGRNGSGKSTLLQVICGTLQPTSGEVKVNGRVAALLELGAGFNPDFTGRENVFLNGAIIGLSREEIEERFEKIERFADIGQFMDQPTKSYSSGMYVRLAFAVAIHASPDILIIDEALSVGDEAFQRKCFARIERLQAQGTTILFVSHSAQVIIELCDRAILLDSGEVLLSGTPKQVVGQYQRLMNLTGDAAQTAREAIKRMSFETAISIDGENTQSALEKATDQDNEADEAANPLDPSWYDPNLRSSSAVQYDAQGAVIIDPHIKNGRGQKVNYIAVGRRYAVSYQVQFHKNIDKPLFGFFFRNVSGVELAGGNNIRVPHPHIVSAKAGDTAQVKFEIDCRLMPGTYFLTVGLMAIVDDDYVFLHRTVDAIAVHVMDGTNEAVYDAGLVSLNTELKTSLIDPHKA